MIIYPAIDIKNGKCVRLMQGKFDNITVYSDDPASIAEKWQSEGAEFIHLVDLDGALEGKSVNYNTILNIAKSASVPVQLGGGIRSMETIDLLLNIGISRVIIGTKAVENLDFVKEAVTKYKEKIVIGIDAKDGFVVTDGWEKISEFKAVDFANKMQSLGVKTIIYTDIDTDGMLSGPNIPQMREMAENLSIDIIASGGVSCIEDIIALKPTGVKGVIVGKALYTKRLSLKDAIKVSL